MPIPVARVRPDPALAGRGAHAVLGVLGALGALGALGTSWACGSGGPAGPEGGAGRPNVLVLIADDLTRSVTGTWSPDVPPPIATPHLDALAARGVVFERALAPSPFCTASRQAFLTGRWPHSIRVTQLLTRLDPAAPTLATVFRGAGYATAAVGKMHWFRKKWAAGDDYGFDHVVDKPEWFAWLTPEEDAAFEEYNRGWSREERRGWSMTNPECRPVPLDEDRQLASFLVTEALGWIDRQERPFLCFLSLYEPHPPYHFPPRLTGAVDHGSLDLPAVDPDALARQSPGLAAAVRKQNRDRGELTDAVLSRIATSYLTSVLWLDEQVGRVLEHLGRAGRFDDTVVVLWSDNGCFLGERGLWGKNYPYREVAEVPLAIAGPGIAPRRTPALASSIDVFPTLCELAGIDVPAWVEGQSLAAVLAGGDRAGASAWCEFSGLAATIQDERWKLFIGARADTGWDQLYDLEQDPGETTNRLGDPALAPVVEELVGRAHALLASTPADGSQPGAWMPHPDRLTAVRQALSVVESSASPPPPRRPDPTRR